MRHSRCRPWSPNPLIARGRSVQQRFFRTGQPYWLISQRTTINPQNKEIKQANQAEKVMKTFKIDKINERQMKNTAQRPTNRHCSVQTSATATIGGRQGPMEGARSQRPAELCRLLSAWAVVGALLVLGPAATAPLFQESNIAALK